MIKAVLFDMDGVLIDTEKIGAKAIELALEKSGLQLEPGFITRLVGVNSAEFKSIMQNTYGSSYQHEPFLELTYTIFDELLGGMPPAAMPGVPDLLDWLKGENYKIAVASSTDIEKVKNHMDSHRFTPYFTAMIGGNMVENSKPAPDIFLLAAKKLGIEPSQCLVVEDSYNGVRSAHAAGCRVVMVPDTLPPTSEMHEKADAILPSVALVPAYIEGYNQGCTEKKQRKALKAAAAAVNKVTL